MKGIKSSEFLAHFISDETIRQWFEYALIHRGLSFAINLFLLVIGFPAVGVGPMLLFLFIFTALRKYAGGYHASTPLRCFLLSALQTLVCVYLLYPFLKLTPYLFAMFLTCSALMIIFHFAPVLPPQIHASNEEQQACGIRARGIVLAEFLVIFLLLMFSLSDLALLGSLGMAMAAMSLLIEFKLQKGGS